MTQDPTATRTSPLLRALLFGGLALGVAFGIKVYTDGQKMNAEAVRHSTKGELEILHKALLAHMESAHLSAKDLPASTPWHPGGLECGEVTFDRGHPPKDPRWAAVVRPGGWGEAKGARYQIKFVRHQAHATWFARRDGDCDGLYETHTLRASLDWSATFEKTFVETQNLGE